MGAWIETNMETKKRTQATVAPRVGAWIETLMNTHIRPALGSHPVWVRGLKPRIPQEIAMFISAVAPRVGAWIETRVADSTNDTSGVAPRVGAWIET